ncbi:centrosomal protein of 164 kDa isoform X2 [Periplaneta americana]|uniref:centrosomal protein of 164 kDa isoform X2 n=1 Tax=Periplaneta americana TaxID=6978 RepID=UPI0037E94D8F
MSCSPSSRTIVCKEIFDENSVPSEEEIRDYAVKIGINPESEPHLLHFARDGLMQALPPGWKPCFDEELQCWYYFNFRSGESRWEHPLDDLYRNLVRKVRSESISSAGEEDSKTSAKEDLKSYEEAAPSASDTMHSVPRSLEPLKGGGGGVFKKGHIQLAPLKKSPVLSPLATPSSASPKKPQSSPLSSPAGSKSPTGMMDPSKGLKPKESVSEAAGRGITTRIELGGGSTRDTAVHKEIPSPTARIDIDRMDVGSLVKRNEESALSRKERLLSAQEKHPRGMTGRGELTLTGGGSMFLKSRQQKQDSPTTASSPSPGVCASPSSDVLSAMVELVPSKDQDENLPKSILRGDQQRSTSAGKPLWDVDPKEMSSEEKQMWRRQELEEERKSVRFNLEQELDIRFNLSELSDQEEGEGEEEEEEEREEWNSDEEDPDEERLIAGIRVSDILNLMDASDLEEVSADEDKLRVSVQSGQKPAVANRQQSVDPSFKPVSILTKNSNRPGARSVNGTRFTVERVHESELEDLPLPTNSLKQPREIEESSEEKAAKEKTDLEPTPHAPSPLVLSPRSEAEDGVNSVSAANDSKAQDVSDLVVQEVESKPNDDVEEVAASMPSAEEVEDVEESDEKYKDDVEESDEKHKDDVEESDEKHKDDVKESDDKYKEDVEEIARLQKEQFEAEKQRFKEELDNEIKRLEEDNDKAVQKHQELLAQRLQESVHEMETEQEERLQTLRSQLAKKEEEDEARLRAEIEEKMASLEQDLKAQQENQEKSIRENMEASLQELRDTLAAERETQIQILQQEQGEIQARQVAEFKKTLEDDRARLEQETTEQIAKFEQELAEKLERERARLEEIHNEHLKEFTAANEAEIEATRTRLQEELTAYKDQLQQTHTKELEAISLELSEIVNLERTAKQSELDEAKKRSESFEKLKKEMEQELEQKRRELATEQESLVIELKAENAVKIEKLKLDFRMEEEQVRREHIERLDELRSRLNHELEMERQRLVKAHEQQNDSTRQELVESSRVFEKLRCEKRLLEDKYRSLKEKYIRLKTDVKISMERRKRRDAGGGTTTGSETERSTSHKTGAAVAASSDGRQQTDGSAVEKQRSSRRRTATAEAAPADNKAAAAEPAGNGDKTTNATTPKNWQGSTLHPPEPPSGKRGEDSVDSDNISSSVSLQQHKVGKHSDPADAHNTNNNRRRRQLFGRLKSASTSRLLQNNNNNSNMSSNNSGQGDSGSNQADDSSCSPVENLRRQLQKLEDLEDQFPASTHTDTYLRYPFTTDSGGVPRSIMMLSYAGQLGSSELEFFRHRIHLERDSVRRAKDFLRAQRTSFQSRQRELKQRQLDGSATARNMLDQLYQEERELTDMEVSLHRTRSLLGEKIIRLRHLEQSLHRASSPRPKGHEKHETKEDATLSDLSSHSGSSGFSSTELGTETQLGKVNTHRGGGACGNGHYQESTEIIQSLENLNTEIREIWEVLNKQQKDGTARHAMPPPPLVYPDMGWPLLMGTVPTLPDRMQGLRHPTQQNLSGMAQFAPTSMPGPQNAAIGWSLQGQNGASQLTQLGAALAHQNGSTPFRTTVLAQGAGGTITDQSLVERTRSLRDWLRQARIDSADLISPGQATL